MSCVEGFNDFLDGNGLLSRTLSMDFNRFKRPDFLHLNRGDLAKLGSFIKSTVLLRQSGNVDRRKKTNVDGATYRDVAAARVPLLLLDGYQQPS